MRRGIGLDVLGAEEARGPLARLLEHIVATIAAAEVLVLLAGDDVDVGDIVVGDDPTQRFVVVRVKNLPDLVKKEAGATGSLALSFAPSTTTGMAYDRIAKRIGDGLRDGGVDADVQVLAQVPPGSPQPTGDLAAGAALGAAALAAGWALWQLVLAPAVGPKKITAAA